MGQVRAELMGDHDVDQHGYKRIVGARRDAVTGQVDVAVVWQDNTLHPTGGSWEPIENIGNILQDLPTPGKPDYEPGEEGVAEATEQCGQWQQHFGKQLVAGTKLLLQWLEPAKQVRKRKRAPVIAVEGYELKTFHGHLTEDYNHPAHVVVYKEQLETRVNNYCKPPEVSPWVSTDRTAADEHMMNLATLETDMSSRDDGQSVATGNSADAFYLQSWILADFACYEFVWAKTGLDLTILESRKKN